MSESVQPAVNRLTVSPVRFWRQSVWWTVLLSSTTLIVVEVLYWALGSRRLFDGLYFEAASSEEMMQTIELRRLAESPIETFWYLHFQPPGFDFLRLFLAIPEWVSAGTPSVTAVDVRLYVLYAVLFGCLNGIIFYWAHAMSGSVVVSAIAVVLWSMYPGNLFIATYLDSMYLSAFLLVLAVHFWFFSIRNRKSRWLLGAAICVLVLALTRTTLQPILIPLFVLIAVVTVTRIFPTIDRRALGFVASAICLLALALPIKQFFLFSTPASSTTSGHHLLGMIQHTPSDKEVAEILVPERVLKNGSMEQNKFNNTQELTTNYKYSRIFFKRLINHPADSIRGTLISAKRSIIKGAGATHRYQRNVLTDDLPWSAAAATLFSGSSYAVFVCTGIAVLALAQRRNRYLTWRTTMLRSLVPAALLIFVLLTLVFGSMRFTDSPATGEAFGWTDGFSWTETDRLKFLLEPFAQPPAILGLVMAVRASVNAILKIF
jgi:hypothetical protein